MQNISIFTKIRDTDDVPLENMEPWRAGRTLGCPNNGGLHSSINKSARVQRLDGPIRMLSARLSQWFTRYD